MDGECSCPSSSCLTGVTCATPVDCGNGICDGLMDGECVCDACYSQDISGSCTVLNTCSSHGDCQPATNQCTCSTGWYGPQCSSNSILTLSPSPSADCGAACRNSSKGLSPGAAAGVSLAVLTFLFGGGAFAFMRAYPGKGIEDAVRMINDKLTLARGATSYASIKPVPVSSAASGARLVSLSEASVPMSAKASTGFSLLKGASPGVAERVSLLAKSSNNAGAKPYGSN